MVSESFRLSGQNSGQAAGRNPNPRNFYYKTFERGSVLERVAHLLQGVRDCLDRGREPDLEALATELFEKLRHRIDEWLSGYRLLPEDREELVCEVFYNVFHYQIATPVARELEAKKHHLEQETEPYAVLPVGVLLKIMKLNCLQQIIKRRRRNRVKEIPLAGLTAHLEDLREPPESRIAADRGLRQVMDPLDNALSSQTVRRWLAPLPARDRWIVALSFFYHVSDADIAEELVRQGITPKHLTEVNIRQCRHRALRRLRTYLSERGEL